MDWWADGIASGALVVSVIVFVRDARTRHSADKMQERLTKASEAQAKASEAQVQAMQDQLDEMRATRESNRPPEVQFVAEFSRRGGTGIVFTLRNVGVAKATGLQIDKASLGGALVDFESAIHELEPGDGIEITAIEAAGAPLKSTLIVRCNELDAPTFVAVPK